MTDAAERDTSASRTRTALIAILVLLILMLAALTYFVARVVAPVGAPRSVSDTPPGIEWVRSIYGYGPAVTEQFFRPLDAAVGPGGVIYGTDPQRSRILSFNADGSFRSLLQPGAPGPGPGRFHRPDAVATDEDGNLYIADNGNQTLIVYSPSGQYVRQWQIPRPTEVAVRDGRVVVATVFGLAVYTTQGDLLGLWGKRGKGPEEFDNPHGLAIAADGTVYVSDTLNARIKAYSKDGRLLWVWPEDRRTATSSGVRPSATGAPLQIPSGMTMDSRGRLVLVDPFAFQIIVLQPTQKGASLVGRYGDFGQSDGLFEYPSGISYDADRDWFVVADTNNDRLQVLRITGSAANPLYASLRRATTGPAWLCAIPLLLLLAAVVLAVLRRHARRRADRYREWEANDEADGQVGDRADDEAAAAGRSAETPDDDGTVEGW